MRKYLLLILLLPICNASNGQIITTIAGVDTIGFRGDGGPATAAKLNSPSRVQPDNKGNVYIVDENNFRIRKINSSGFISTVAGNGISGHGGDGGPATAAGFNVPVSIAIDTIGNMFIVDNNSSGLSYIRKVNKFGIIETIAGNGTIGYSGDGGSATAAAFKSISDIAVDVYGNIYATEYANHVIRKINVLGIIETIAGNHTPGFSGDGGLATAAQFYLPCGLAIDPIGNIYVADMGNKRIRRIDTAGIVTTFAGNGTLGFSGDGGQATAAALSQPMGLAVDSADNVYIADQTSRIRKIDSAGIITTIAGNGIYGWSGDNGPAIVAELYDATGVSVDASGNVYIADIRNYTVRKISGQVKISLTNSDIAKREDIFKIWPEPNQGTFTIYVPSSTGEPTQILISNLIGQKIEEIITTTNKEIPIRMDSPPGLYFVTTITSLGKQTVKMILR